VLRKATGGESIAALLGKGNDASSAPGRAWFPPRPARPAARQGLAIEGNCCSPRQMNAGPPADAITRIDAALARIEAATAKLRDAHGGLQQRHIRLRDEVASVLADLDALIADRAEAATE
jgi:hypothetical protein